MRKKWFTLLALLLALALVAAACADDDDDAQPEEAPEGIVLIGADGLMSDTFVTIPDTEGMFFSGPALADVAAYEEFSAKYTEKFGEAPIQSFHAHAFDATNLLLDKIEEVAQEGDDGTLTINRQELRDATYATEGFEGLTGSLTCNEFGDCAQPAVSVYQNIDPSASMGGLFANVLFTSRPEGAEGKTGEAPEAPPARGEVVVGPNDPVQIATLQAISGAVASLGTDQTRATEIAIDDRGGELLGHPIEVQGEDDLCAAEGGTTGGQRIVSNEQIIGVIGSSCSGAAVPASEIISKAGLTMISGSNTSPGLTATGYLEEGDLVAGENWSAGYFRTAHNDEFQGQGAAQFVFEFLGLTQMATIHDGDPYTEGLVTQFEAFFEDLGGEVVLATAVSADDTDMRPVLTEIAGTDAQGIYFPIFQPAGDFIAKQAAEVFPEILREPFEE